MTLIGPEKYRLKIVESSVYAVTNYKGGSTFIERATSKIPKIYIISSKGLPIYVGITKQPMNNRLRFGFKATGKGGYHGYKWRNHLKNVDIDIWYDENDIKRTMEDIEAIEAEVVYLIRKHYKQWPKHQTEIHFHQSNMSHREQAKKIFNFYTK